MAMQVSIQVNTPIVVPIGAKVFLNSFHENWIDCFKDTESCCISTFCPCIQFAKNYVVTAHPQYGFTPQKVVSDNMAMGCCACALYSAGMYFGGNLAMGIFGCLNRGTLRKKYQINQGDCADTCSDCVIHTFCWACALSQEWRELQWRQDQPMVVTAIPGTVVAGTQQGFVAQQQQPTIALATQQSSGYINAGPAQPQYAPAPQPMYAQPAPVQYGAPVQDPYAQQFAAQQNAQYGQPQYSQPMTR